MNSLVRIYKPLILLKQPQTEPIAETLKTFSSLSDRKWTKLFSLLLQAGINKIK